MGYDADGDRGARRYNGFLVSDLEALARPGPADPHAMLDAAGFLIPVADLANSGLYLSEGDWGNAFLSVVGAVPLVGDAAKGLVKGVDAIGGAVRGVDDVAGTGARTFGDPSKVDIDTLIKEAAEKYPNKVRSEWHHVMPKYLGGDVGSYQVLIPASYHQQITNKFRELAPYGQPKGRWNASEVQAFMDKVYAEFPIPVERWPDFRGGG